MSVSIKGQGLPTEEQMENFREVFRLLGMNADGSLSGDAAGAVRASLGLPPEDTNRLNLIQVFTFLTLPSAASYGIGLAWVTDVGVGGSLWRCNGSNWGLASGSCILYDSAVQSSQFTGTFNETTQWSMVLIGGLLGLNGSVEIEARTSHNNSAGNKIWRVRIGNDGTTVSNNTRFADVRSTTTLSANIGVRIQARNSQASQIGINGSGNYGASSNAFDTGTVDMTVNQNLLFTAQTLDNTSDNMRIESLRVKLVRP